jgi:hypothetical protein
LEEPVQVLWVANVLVVLLSGAIARGRVGFEPANAVDELGDIRNEVIVRAQETQAAFWSPPPASRSVPNPSNSAGTALLGPVERLPR